jgi:hypothetical protein
MARGRRQAALERLIAQLIDFKELAAPRVKWEPMSADEDERLACVHIGSLFESYEPEWWGMPPCTALLCVPPPLRFSVSNGSFCYCKRRFALGAWRRFEIVESLRKLILISVLTAVSPNSIAYFNVALAVLWLSASSPTSSLWQTRLQTDCKSARSWSLG